jgi:phage baseplate assembly protein W
MAQDIVGPALPAVRLSGGYFADRDALDTAFGDLIIAIMCPVGGRFMRRGFGSNLEQLLFSPSDSALIAALQGAVQAAAQQWVPTMRIVEVLVRPRGGTVDMNIKFALASDTTTQRQKLLTVPRSQAIQFLSSRST